MNRMRRWWMVGLVGLAAGSIFTFGSPASGAGSDDEARQGTQIKDDDTVKGKSAATTDGSNEEAPTAAEKDPSGEEDQ